MRKWIFLLLTIIGQSLVAQEDSVYLIFSRPGGIYDSGFELDISCSNPDGKIYYTTDGSDPGSSAFRYEEPIAISDVTVIRAKAYVDGKPTPITTQTYFTGRTYTTVVVSINMNSEYFFSDTLGILAKGCCADSIPPYYGANFWKDWERKMNIELYEPDGTLAFNQLAGVRVFGGWSKSLPQKSLTVIARSKYGLNRFDYPIFEERPMNEYKTFILRNSGSDFNVTQFRDAFLTQLASPLNIDIQEYRPAAVYLNGTYWGIMNIREKLNEHYLEGNFGVNPDSVDLMKHRMDLQVGTRDDYKDLLDFLIEHDFSLDSNMQVLEQWMDVDNYLDYNIAEIYIDNRDAGGNIRYWRSYAPETRWRWILFDTDMSYGVTEWDGYNHNALAAFTDPHGPAWPNPFWSTFIIRKLLENDSIRTVYINKWADYLNTVFHPNAVSALLDEFVALTQTEMTYHVERWKPWGNDDMQDWHTNVEVMRTFGQYRPSYCRQHVMEYFGLPDTSTVTISLDIPGGIVRFNSVAVTDHFSGIYFDSVLVHISATPYFDYRFTGWDGLEADTSHSWLLLKDEHITAHFEPKPKSKHFGTVRITEISAADTVSQDWVELYNTGQKPVDISGWLFTDKNYDRGFVFPEGTRIAGGEFLIVAEDLMMFINAYSDTIPAIGNCNFGLSQNGEWIGLYDAELLPVDTLTFGPSSNAEVLGIDDPATMGNWNVEKATPGKPNPKFPKEDSEKMKLYLYLTGGGVIALILIFFLVRGKRKKPRKVSISDHSEVSE